MAGGTWTSQNKPLPGVYINVSSRGSMNTSVSERGIVAIAKSLSWGEKGKIRKYVPGADTISLTGYSATEEDSYFLSQIITGTNRTSPPFLVYLYRLEGTGGATAEATVGGLHVKAKYEGERGNDITVIVSEDPDNEGLYEVKTVVDGSVVDAQEVTEVSQLADNAWCVFSGKNTEIEATAGTPLAGGINPEVSAKDYAKFLTALEPYQFDVLIYDGEDMTTMQAVASFVKRLSNNIGQKCQAVMANAEGFDSEFVISVKNGLELNDGKKLTAQEATWWVGGAEAGAAYFQSLTYAKHPYAVAACPKLAETEVVEAVKAGHVVFIDNFDEVKICQDINTLTTFTPDKGEEFSKNRVMRVFMSICNDTYEYFSKTFLGATSNNRDGRNILRGWLVGYINEMQANGGVQNFSSDDVIVEQGNTLDAVLIYVGLQPVDAIEKVYTNMLLRNALDALINEIDNAGK